MFVVKGGCAMRADASSIAVRSKKLMTYYSVLAVTPTAEDWISDYIGPANALVAKHGGTYLARTANHERLEGEGEDAALRIILQWPSRETALAFMNDPD